MSLRQELYTALELVDKNLPKIELSITSFTKETQDKTWHNVCAILMSLDSSIMNIINSGDERLINHALHYCKIFAHEVWNDYERGKSSRKKQLSYFEWAVPV